MLAMETAGRQCWDLYTRRGAYAGLIAWEGTHARVYFNSTATRGSRRRFESVQAALEYVVARRQKKGWGI